MRFIFQLFGIIILAHIFEMFLPWYSLAAAAFIGGYILKSKANFFAGFLAIALLWALKAWLMDSVGTTDLVQRVANIFMLKEKVLLYVIMAVLGGLVGGFAALTGSLLKGKIRDYR